MEYLSPRVSVDRSSGRFSVVISARLDRAREGLLIAWCLAWFACGAYIIYALLHMPASDQRQYVLVFLAFWAYFALRVGKAAVWRLKGFELWRLKDGVFTIKNSILGYGKAQDHFVENMSELGALSTERDSWRWQMNESFWVIGGERLGFAYQGRRVLFGKGLTTSEMEKLLRLLKTELEKARKATV
jgi:hypothetical protein